MDRIHTQTNKISYIYYYVYYDIYIYYNMMFAYLLGILLESQALVPTLSVELHFGVLHGRILVKAKGLGHVPQEDDLGEVDT